jgi:hypothetical protein
MTEDELDRALFALPLEEPPAGLHGQILAATVLRPAPVFAVWERWLLGAALIVAALVTLWIWNSAPHTGTRITDAVISGMRALGLFSNMTYVWAVVGLASAWWISRLNFMPPPRPTVYNR